MSLYKIQLINGSIRACTEYQYVGNMVVYENKEGKKRSIPTSSIIEITEI